MDNSELIDVAPAPSPVLAGYQPIAGVYDEAFDHSGQLRPHWQPLCKQLNRLGSAEVRRRWELAQNQIANDGVTFNPYDQQGRSRPWTLDAIALVLDEREWAALADGLNQRAHLLELVLRDILGPQQLFRDRVLPPDVLYGHPDYYPAYHGLPSAGGQHLTLYAADLARAPDGQWWVTGDRTRVPFGLGHTLENRIVTSRMLPHAFRTCQVQRLAPFFIALQETLRSMAPRMKDNPRIVLWSRGPTSRGYFEDAYLARYLGYTLVEGGDLAVRDNKVWLKTLGGLLPVEVLFRRLDDDACDAVELNPDSACGVSGLLEVLRSNTAVLANVPGSRLVESPIMLAFLPRVCQALLGEPLKVPGVATWWCGEAVGLEYVLSHLDSLIIRMAYRRTGQSPLYPAQMTTEQRAELVARIRQHPSQYVGQQTVLRSTTPVLTNGGCRPWHLAFRSFLIHRRDDFLALPGGLARVSPTAETLESTMTSGERSQDVWIRSEKPIAKVSLLSAPGDVVQLRRSGSDLPSRVADNLFWLGRMVERAEGNVRLLQTVMNRITSELESPDLLRCLYRALAEQGQLDPDFLIEEFHAQLPTVEEQLPVTIFDASQPRSLRATLNQAMRLVSIVRDRVSIDAWRVIHQIDQDFKQPADLAAVDFTVILNLLDKLLTQLLAFSGLAQESMTRSQGWRFLDLGRRIERAWQTSVLLRGTLVTPLADEPPLLESVLQTADSIMTYRIRYLATFQAAPVLDLLLIDESNPRSVGYQLRSIEEHLEELPRDEVSAAISPEQRRALSLRNSVRLAIVADLARVDPSGQRSDLDRLLQRLSDQLPKLSDTVSNRFLIHAGLSRHYGSQTLLPP